MIGNRNIFQALEDYFTGQLDRRFNKDNRFGDVVEDYGNEMLDYAKTFAGNAGDISFSGFREAAPDMLDPYIRAAGYLPDMAAAGLLGAIGLGEKGVAALAEGIAGGTESEDRLARDLLGAAEVAGVNPQGRIAGILAPYMQSYMKARIPDYQYAGRSLLQGDLGGVREAFTETDMLPRAVGADITRRQQDPQYLQDFGNPETTAQFYSPSLRAAQNLPQNKGSYEQLRNWMITKGGAKPEELEFSGADRLFNMKQVTKQEIVDYLENNDPSLKSYTLSSADGATGKPMVGDFSEARDQIEQDEPLMSQIESEYIDRMAEDMGYLFSSGEDFFDLSDLYTEGVQEGAYTIDEIVNDFTIAGGSLADTSQKEQLRGMLENYQKTLKKYNETGFHGDRPTDQFIVRVGDEFTFAMDEVDAVEKMSGGYETIRSEARQEYFDLLEDEFDQDPIAFAENYRLGGGQTNFKRGETRHADYFPAGGYNYNENLIKFEDPTGMIDAEDLPKTYHHGEHDQGTILHTRQADFEGGRLDRDRIRYVGEIQLDANRTQMDSFMAPTPRENLVNLSKARQEIQESIIPQQNALRARKGEVDNAFSDKMLLRGIDGKLEDAAVFAMIKRYNTLHKSPDGQRMSPDIPFIDEEEWLKTKGISDTSILDRLEDVAPYQLAPQNLYRLIREPLDYKYKKELLNAYIEIAKHDNPEGYQNEDFVKAIMKAKQDYKDINTAAEEVRKQQRKITEKYDVNTVKEIGSPSKLVPKYGSGTNAPMLESRNKQIDYALRKSLLDAANDEYIDFVAFPDDRGAIGSVGGSSDPNQGTVDYYRENVQNRLKSVLRKIDKDLKIEDINISQQEFENEFMDGGDFNAKGVRMTPELRKKLIEKGLPSFGIVGGVGLMDFMVRDNKDGRNDSLLSY